MYDFAPEKTRCLVYGDFCLAIRLSFASSSLIEARFFSLSRSSVTDEKVSGSDEIVTGSVAPAIRRYNTMALPWSRREDYIDAFAA
jgi:hypothetical protein